MSRTFALRPRGQRLSGPRDEVGHFQFFKDGVRLSMEEDRDRVLEALNFVIHTFRMPATDIIPDWDEQGHIIGRLGIFDDRIYLRHVVRPVLQALNVSATIADPWMPGVTGRMEQLRDPHPASIWLGREDGHCRGGHPRLHIRMDNHGTRPRLFEGSRISRVVQNTHLLWPSRLQGAYTLEL